jgi:hypothetical protein
MGKETLKLMVGNGKKRKKKVSENFIHFNYNVFWELLTLTSWEAHCVKCFARDFITG